MLEKKIFTVEELARIMYDSRTVIDEDNSVIMWADIIKRIEEVLTDTQRQEFWNYLYEWNGHDVEAYEKQQYAE